MSKERTKSSSLTSSSIDNRTNSSCQSKRRSKLRSKSKSNSRSRSRIRSRSKLKLSESGSDYEPSCLVYLAVLCAQMSSILMGSCFGWSAPALEDMQLWTESPFRPTSSQASLIASFLPIGAIFGGMVSGFCIDYIGRKNTLVCLGVPYGVGYLLIALSASLVPILIGRILTGFALGITICVLPTYVAEISTPKIRGMLGMTFNFFVVSGVVFMDLVYIGNFHWNQLAYWALAPALLLSGSMLLMPESPSWIVNHCKDPDRALRCLRRLRSSRSNINQELDMLVDGSKRLLKSTNSKLRFSCSTLRRADVYKPMSIGIVLLFFQQFCGLNAVQFNSNQIFKDSGSSLEPKYATLVSNGGMLVATLVGGLIIDRFGRRILIIISSIGLMLSIGTLGVYYYLNPSTSSNSTDLTTTGSSVNFTIPTAVPSIMASTIAPPHDPDKSSILPVICVTLFFSSFSLGVGPIVWIIITEITPPQTIGLIVTTSSIMVWVFTFVMVNEVNNMYQMFGPHGTYWIFAGISLTSAVFAYFLPETKGKTMAEIVGIFKYEH